MAGEAAELALTAQLKQTQTAVTELAKAVDNLAHRDRMRSIILAILGLITAGLAVLAFYTITHFSNTNDELRAVFENSFMFSCDSSNSTREVLREDNIADAEALILVTNADSRNPAAADAYRKVTRENSEKIEDRDCRAELREITG